MNIGDRVQLINNAGSMIWIFKEYDGNLFRSRLESLDGFTSQWVKHFDFLANYIKIDDDNDTQLHFYGWGNDLPKGKEKENKAYCYHDWKKYVGLKEVYLFCTKCDEKKEFVE